MKPYSLILSLITLILPSLASAIDMAGYERVWHDDFNDDTLNPDYWTYDAGVGVWNTELNQELQYYTDRPRNVRIEEGNLVIEAHRESYDPDGNFAFTSGRVKTSGRMDFQYGIVRAKIKLPDLKDGLWPAFWTLGDVDDGWPQGGEIDIMEGGHEVFIADGTVNQNTLSVVHWAYPEEKVDNPWEFNAYFPNPDSNPNEDYIYASVESLQDWHVWTMEWTDSFINMYIDDNPEPYFQFEFDPALITEFTEPQSVLFNIAVGGNFPEIRSPNLITAPFPAQMQVDWIEVWQKPGIGSLFTSDMDGVRLEGRVAVGELAEGTDGLEFDSRIPIDDEIGSIYSWNNLDIAEGSDPVEGTNSLSFSVPNPGDWYGGGIQTLSNFYNFEKFADGYVVLDLKTTTQTAFRLGIGSMVTGNGEVSFAAGEEKWGLVRDGQWHTLRIPVGAFGESVDLATVNILLYLVNDPPGSAVSMEIDNLYWEQATEEAPTPENGNYGIFTETPENRTAGSFAFTEDGELFLWEGSLRDGPATEPSEGSEVWSFATSPGFGWWGAGLYATRPLNLTAFENGSFHFDLKTTGTVPFMIGMKSDLHKNVGQLWIHFPGPGQDPYGFARDGQWHSIEIPVQELLELGNINLYEVVQVFEILGVKGAISNLAIDNIYFSGGATANRDRFDSGNSYGYFNDLFPDAIITDGIAETWMGYMYLESFPMVYHYGRGWIYLPSFAIGGGVYAYDMTVGAWMYWIESGAGLWVYVWDNSPGWRYLGS